MVDRSTAPTIGLGTQARGPRRLLVVEDDTRIGAAVCAGFREQGYDVTWTVTGTAAIEAAAQARAIAGTGTGTGVDALLLDLGLPDMDGLAVCRALRRDHPDTVIIILTARDDDIDVIAGLESGADDYVTKPFAMMVLQARVAAHLRRSPPREDEHLLLCGDLVIDSNKRQCLLAGQEIALRVKLFDLLERLAIDAGEPVSREDLMADVWDVNWVGSTKTLDVHVASLRQRIADTADALTAAGARITIPTIRTVRGVGYQLHCP